jgi:hypothetical protein
MSDEPEPPERAAGRERGGEQRRRPTGKTHTWPSAAAWRPQEKPPSGFPFSVVSTGQCLQFFPGFTSVDISARCRFFPRLNLRSFVSSSRSSVYRFHGEHASSSQCKHDNRLRLRSANRSRHSHRPHIGA